MRTNRQSRSNSGYYLWAPRTSAERPCAAGTRASCPGTDTAFVPHYTSDRSIAVSARGLQRMMSREFPAHALAIFRVVLMTGLLGWLALLTRPAMAAEPEVTEGFINTSPAEVWRIFTTSEGYKLTGAA